MEIPKIKSATESERQRVFSTIMLGFASDPLYRWFWPDAFQYLDAQPALDAYAGKAIGAGSAVSIRR